MTITTERGRRLREDCGLPELSVGTPRARERLAAVRAAAVVEFHRHGFFDGSLDDIARRSGVSKPTIYAYAETKERLFLDAVGDALIVAYAGLPDVGPWSDADSARTALRAFLLVWAQRLLEPDTIDLRRGDRRGGALSAAGGAVGAHERGVRRRST